MAQFNSGEQVLITIPSVNINGTKGTITNTYANEAEEDVYDILVEEGADVFEMISIREINLSAL